MHETTRFKFRAKELRQQRSWLPLVYAAAVMLGLFSATERVTAEPVSVNSPAGQGFVFSHNSNCYVLLPAHVHGATTDLSLSAGSPPVVGAGKIFHTFAPGMDLSLGLVTGGLDGRCTDRFSDLQLNVDELLAPGGAVSFVTVSRSGHVERVPGRVSILAYEMMVIDVEATSANMFKGRSGGIVLADDTPVGMLVKAGGTKSAEAIRMDAIADRIRRLLVGLGAADEPNEGYSSSGDDTSGQAGGAPRGGIMGLVEEITKCSAEPVTPETNCWTFAAGGSPLLVAGESLPFAIELRLADGKASAVRNVQMWSNAEDGVSSPPKTILIERSAGSPERPVWLSFARADMSPLGRFDVTHGAGLRTSALRITILDAWNPTLPLRLDGIDVQ